MVMLVVVATRENQKNTTNKHEGSQKRFANMIQQVLDGVSLRSRKKWNSQ
jgi:hypothetical protein